MSAHGLSWQHRYTREVVSAFGDVLNQLLVDLLYEHQAPRLAQSVTALRSASAHAQALHSALRGLSPVARAAIYELHYTRRPRFTRSDLDRLLVALGGLAPLLSAAAEYVADAHLPLPEDGQGSGSVAGRDSDLRAVSLTVGHETFRSPKDKFAVRVIEALCRLDYGDQVTGKGQRGSLTLLLDELWTEFWKHVARLAHDSSDSYFAVVDPNAYRQSITDLSSVKSVTYKHPSWRRVVGARHKIAEHVARSKQIRSRRQRKNEQLSSTE